MLPLQGLGIFFTIIAINMTPLSGYILLILIIKWLLDKLGNNIARRGIISSAEHEFLK